MQVTAKIRHLRIAPKKVRLVANLVKGLPVEQADQQLQFVNKAAALPLLKLVRSAVANATNNNDLKKESLSIKNVIVDEGFTLKRWKPRAMGRATSIRKRSSHVTVVLEGKKKQTKKKKEEKNNKKTEKKVAKK